MFATPTMNSIVKKHATTCRVTEGHREREEIGGEKRRADEGEGQGEAEEEKISGREWKKRKEKRRNVAMNVRETPSCTDDRP